MAELGLSASCGHGACRERLAEAEAGRATAERDARRALKTADNSARAAKEALHVKVRAAGHSVPVTAGRAGKHLLPAQLRLMA